MSTRGKLIDRQVFSAIMAHIPGTRQFRIQYSTRILRVAKEHRGWFDSLRCLSNDNKIELRNSMRRHEVLLAALDLMQTAESNMTYKVGLGVAFLVAFVGTVLFARWWFDPNSSLDMWIGFGLINFFASMLAFLIMALPQLLTELFAPRLRKYVVSNTFLNIWLMVFFSIYAVIAYKVFSDWVPTQSEVTSDAVILVGTVALSCVVYFVALFLSIVMADVLENKHLRSQNRLFPDTRLVGVIVRIAHNVEIYPQSWTDLNFKRWLMANLETAAVICEKYLPRQLRSGDPYTDFWEKEIAQQRAASIRALKKLIISPASDTREKFMAHAASALQSVASGNWENLERSEPDRAQTPRVWRSRLINFARAIIVSLLPWLLFWLIQQTSFAIDDPLSGYLKIGALVWTILSLLSAFDPTFSAKIGATKDIWSLLLGKNQNK